jgi:hypothetical protein
MQIGTLHATLRTYIKRNGTDPMILISYYYKLLYLVVFPKQKNTMQSQLVLQHKSVDTYLNQYIYIYIYIYI